ARAPDAREAVAEIQGALPELIRELGVPPEEAPELGALHEQVQVYLSQERYPAVHRTAERLLARWPRFAAARNNDADAWWRQGNLPQAITATRKVLELAPDNLHALSNLT